MSSLAPHDSRLGRLQRGLGKGFLQAIAAPTDAAPEVLQCVLEDRRVSPYDSRAHYYGELCDHLDVDIGPLVEQAAGSDGAVDAPLSVEVLAELIGREHNDAAALLAAPERFPEVTIGVVAYLRDWQQWSARNLPLPAIAMLAERLDERDELIGDVEAYGEFWQPFRAHLPRVQTAFIDCAALAAAEAAAVPMPAVDPHAMSTADVLVGAAEHGYKRPFCEELARRSSEQDRALLATCVEQDDSPQRIRFAARALAELGDLRLLDLCEDMFDRADDTGDPVRGLSMLDRARRAALAAYFATLPSAPTLPLARRWWRRGGFFRAPAARVMAQHAEARDRGWLEDHLRARLPRSDGTDVVEEIEALVHIGDAGSAPLLRAAFERLPYGWARVRAASGLAAHPTTEAAAGVWAEAMWDCEEDVRKLGCRHSPTDIEALRRRRDALAAEPLEDEEVRRAASARAAG